MGKKKGQLKKNVLLRMCPDCGRLLSWNGYLSAFTHSTLNFCVYMETMEGQRIFDDEMQEENQRKFEEYIQSLY